ncbi:MAG: HD domain-containing protein [Actinobacteria bacterium]|nr:HD domain-containing protein [Actinomycetota bacterium]
MASPAYRSAGLIRSLTLLWTFVLASAAILCVGAFVLSSVLTRSFREQVLDDSARQIALYTDSVLTPMLVRTSRVVASPRARKRLTRAVARSDEVTGIVVWSRRGNLVVSTPPGQRAEETRRKILSTTRSGRTMAEVGEVSTKVHKSRSSERAVVVWSPLRTSSGKPVGVAQVHLRPDPLDASVASATWTVWVVVGGVFLILWLALAVLVRGAASRLSRQNESLQGNSRELSASARRVEESLLETIETLNAAVEARDPYTAGHSQRVRRVALAIGRELSLSAHQLGLLGTAALFHDVGKIGIPDSLTKAGPLEPSEASIMREHVRRGADIMSKVSSFEEAVPAIRSHHERWDGLGYPDGLRGEEIPLEASIVGLADAWDAMTTDRPYARGLSLNEAMMQIRSGRGKQFNPVVVDAFWQVAKRRPSDILPLETSTASLAAV